MKENKHLRFTDVNPSPIAIILLIFEHFDVSDLMHSGPGYLHVMLHISRCSEQTSKCQYSL